MAVTNADILGWLNANPGADDALIASTMQAAGVSPAQMAEATGTNVADITARYEAAIAPPPVTTVEDLYRQYAGREADPGGLAFWKQGFGDSIDANEIASFQNAVAGARAQGTEPAATTPAATTPAATTPAVTHGALSQAAAVEPDVYLTPEQEIEL